MKIKRYNVQGAWINEPFYEIGSVDMVIYKDHLAEVERLKALLREYRKTGTPHGYCLIRTAGLVHGTKIDDRCDLCKRTDKELEP